MMKRKEENFSPFSRRVRGFDKIVLYIVTFVLGLHLYTDSDTHTHTYIHIQRVSERRIFDIAILIE
jgi:hypothetical protein